MGRQPRGMGGARARVCSLAEGNSGVGGLASTEQAVLAEFVTVGWLQIFGSQRNEVPEINPALHAIGVGFGEITMS